MADVRDYDGEVQLMMVFFRHRHERRPALPDRQRY